MITEAEVDRELVRRGGFAAFVRLAWPQVEPAPLLWNWHHDIICDALEDVSAGKCRRLLVNLPPGMSKTLLISTLWPAWDWIRRPDRRFICASYDGPLATHAARLHRDLFASQWFRNRWDVAEVSAEQETKVSSFQNSMGGGRFSAGVGSGFTGRHAHIHIYDDPLKARDVQGSVEHIRGNLERVETWYRETMPSRSVSPATLAKVLVMQRLHLDDLSGVVLKEPGWRHINLPLEYDPARAGDYDPRTDEGELLFPARVDAETAAELRRTLGARAYNTQYNQRPSEDGGSVLQRKWLSNFYRELPKGGGTWLQSWDMSFKETSDGSYVVGQVWYRKDGCYYLVDQFRDRVDCPGAIAAMVTMSGKWPRAVRKIVEDKANGPAIVDLLKRRIPGLVTCSPDGGKEARCNAVSPLFEAGNVYLPAEVPWIHDYIEEMATFPGAPHDDQVDATSQALSHLMISETGFRQAMGKLKEMGLV